MITLLTTFKPFTGDDAIRQRNALVSWLAMGPDVEVMVFATSPGQDAVVDEMGLKQYPHVTCCPDGRLPRVDGVFEIAQREGRHDLQAFLNGDIVLGRDFLDAAQAISHDRFLMIGRRWGTRALEELAASDDLAPYIAQALDTGHYARGQEYFAYRRGTLKDVPPMYPGTIYWDNIMVEHCLSQRIPVIDATPDVLAIHQDHEHLVTTTGLDMTAKSPAQDENSRIAEGRRKCSEVDATHVLRRGRLHSATLSPWHLRQRALRCLGRVPAMEPIARRLARATRFVEPRSGSCYLRNT